MLPISPEVVIDASDRNRELPDSSMVEEPEDGSKTVATQETSNIDKIPSGERIYLIYAVLAAIKVLEGLLARPNGTVVSIAEREIASLKAILSVTQSSN